MHLVGGSSLPNGIRSGWDKARVGSVTYGVVLGGHAKCHGTRHARSAGTSMARAMETLTACHKNSPTAYRGKPHGSTAISHGLPWPLPWHATSLSKNKQCASVYFENQSSYVRSRSSMTKLPVRLFSHVHSPRDERRRGSASASHSCVCKCNHYVQCCCLRHSTIGTHLFGPVLERDSIMHSSYCCGDKGTKK